MLKRLFDIAVAGVALVALLPALFLIAMSIMMSSPGPVLYRGKRTGRHGVPFRILKFRTMVVDGEGLGGPSTARNDPRLTRVGRFLRRFKLDELPQLLNVLRGDMSIVGPRPQVSTYTDLYSGEYLDILSVRPGLTDYASIEFVTLDDILGDHDVDQFYRTVIEPRKNTMRLRYVRERSLWVDVKIILLTIVAVIRIPFLWGRRRSLLDLAPTEQISSCGANPGTQQNVGAPVTLRKTT